METRKITKEEFMTKMKEMMRRIKEHRENERQKANNK